MSLDTGLKPVYYLSVLRLCVGRDLKDLGETGGQRSLGHGRQSPSELWILPLWQVERRLLGVGQEGELGKELPMLQRMR